jgi:hypothetical protein
MMFFRLLFFFIALNNAAFAQQSIQGILVPAGETYTLDQNQRDLIIGSLIMEDNATLIVPSNFEYWNVRIQSARFGEDTRIIARGLNGANATGTAQVQSGKGKCQRKGGSGRPGFGAPKGEAGQDGVRLNIEIGIEGAVSLTIDASGGDGGITGDGGKGGKGGRGSCNNRCNGEKGGVGGSVEQSAGGDGGDVRLVYWTLSPSGTSDPAIPAPGIQVISNPGSAGLFGNVGAGGDGGNRTDCKITKNRAKGSQGEAGRVYLATAGLSGEIALIRVPDGASIGAFTLLPTVEEEQP